MMLGGPLSFSSGGYASTPVAKVLPVALIDGLAASADSSKLLDGERFRPKLTTLGGIHPVTRTIERIEDFAGKVVLIPYQLSVHNMLFHRLLKEKGLKLGTTRDKTADVFQEVVAPFQMPDAIELDEDGEIAGFIVAEPFGTKVINSGNGEALHLSCDLWPKHPCCVLVMRDEVIEKNTDAVHELTRSLVRSGMALEAQPKPGSIIGADFLGQDADLIYKVLTEPKERISTDELFPVIDDLAKIQDYMKDEMGILTDKIDLDKFVDTRFARDAGAK